MGDAIKNICEVIQKQAEAVSDVTFMLEIVDEDIYPVESVVALEKTRMGSVEQMQTLILELTRLITSGDTGGQEDE